MKRTRHILNHNEEVEPEGYRKLKVIQPVENSYTVVPEDWTENILIVTKSPDSSATEPLPFEIIVNMPSSFQPGGGGHLEILSAGFNEISIVSGDGTMAIVPSPNKENRTNGEGAYIEVRNTAIDNSDYVEDFYNGGLQVFGDLVETNTGTSTYIPKRGTVSITGDTLLNATDHDQKTLICVNINSDITLTVPIGLGKDFDCNVVSENSGSRFTQIVQGSGMSFQAPHGTKILSGYTAHIIKLTDQEICNIQGELVP